MQGKVLGYVIGALIVGVLIGYVAHLAFAGEHPELSRCKSELSSCQKELSACKGELSKFKKSYLEEIKKRGKLIVGTSADWPPFEYVKDGKIVGIDIEIAKRIAKALGVELEIKDMKFAALIPALKSGQIDMILADITPTAEREKEVDFSIPYYTSKGYAVLTLKEKASELKSVESLYGKKIGVQLGTIQEEWAKENLKGKAEIISYDRVYPEMVMALKRSDIDAMIIGDIIAGVLQKRDPDLALAFYAGAPTIGAAVAVPEGAEDLKYEVNKVLESLIESGEMAKIFEEQIAEWLGE